MNDTADQQLLFKYAQDRSEAAFREFVRRYLSFVYSAALRITRDRHLAEDVTQSVFVVVAKEAGKVAAAPVLAGWLHRTTRNIAANLIRAETRRRVREHESVSMNITTPDVLLWDEIAPQLDAALDNLGDADRDAVLLRFFQKKTLAEVGAVLRVSEDAAQKRVSRALERLRKNISKAGVKVGATSLVAGLSAHAVQAAPAGLAIPSVSAAVLSGGSLAVTALIPATRIITMTTIQKTAVALTLALTFGFAVREFRENSRLRTQLNTLQQEQMELRAQIATARQAQVAAVSSPQVEALPNAAPGNDDQWAFHLLSLNTNDWRRAFAVGQQVAALEPIRGWTLLHANWSAITNVSARQQLLKAFSFAHHERLPAALHLALLDPSPEVQNWSLLYLKDLALRDFSTDYTAALEWISARSNSSAAEAFADAVARASLQLRQQQGNQLHAQLDVLKRSSDWFAKYPETLTANGLDQTLATITQGNDPRGAKLALDLSARLQLGEEWRRSVVLPALASEKPWEVRLAAASALGQSKSEWAVEPVLDILIDAVGAPQAGHVSSLASAFGEIGSPRAIPSMIALMEADPTGRAAYDIGYFGLRKLTGVGYDVQHDAAWWRKWWESNKHRYPADVQAMAIPRFATFADNPPVAQ